MTDFEPTYVDTVPLETGLVLLGHTENIKQNMWQKYAQLIKV